MKANKFLFASLAAGLLLTSCSSEIDEPVAVNDGNVVITAKMPENIKTRLYSDGTKATVLHYAVYEEGTNNVIFTSENTVDPQATYNGDLTFSLSLNLVKGRSYDLVFWADKGAGAPNTFSPTAKDVTINYDNLKCNEEDRDAFFSVEKNLTVTGAMKKSIQLYRPFGQLNIGTSDLEDAKKAGVELGTTSVTVKDVYNNLNLMTGVASVTGDFDGTELTYDFNTLPEGETFPVKGYEYLSMNYILTGNVIISGNVNKAQQETKDIEIAIKDKNGVAVNSFAVSSVPFRRNYRTNVYGKLLTSTVDYVIEIVEDYYVDDNNYELPYVEVKSSKELKDALDAGKPARLMEDMIQMPFYNEDQIYDGEVDLNGHKLYINGRAAVRNNLILKNGEIVCNDLSGLSLFTVGGYGNLELSDVTFSNTSYAQLPVQTLVRIAANQGNKGSVRLNKVVADLAPNAIGVGLQGNATTPDFTIDIENSKINATVPMQIAGVANVTVRNTELTGYGYAAYLLTGNYRFTGCTLKSTDTGSTTGLIYLINVENNSNATEARVTNCTFVGNANQYSIAAIKQANSGAMVLNLKGNTYSGKGVGKKGDVVINQL